MLDNAPGTASPPKFCNAIEKVSFPSSTVSLFSVTCLVVSTQAEGQCRSEIDIVRARMRRVLVRHARQLHRHWQIRGALTGDHEINRDGKIPGMKSQGRLI